MHAVHVMSTQVRIKHHLQFEYRHAFLCGGDAVDFSTPGIHIQVLHKFALR